MAEVILQDLRKEASQYPDYLQGRFEWETSLEGLTWRTENPREDILRCLLESQSKQLEAKSHLFVSEPKDRDKSLWNW